MDSIKASAALGLIASAVWPLMGACATQSPDYVGVELGLISQPETAHFRINVGELDSDIPTHHEIDRGVFVGHQFNRNFAIEVGYRDLGTLSGPLKAPPGFAPEEGDFQLTFKGPQLALVGILPFGRWEAYGKLGTMITDTHLSLDATGEAGVAQLERSAWNAAVTAEAGIRFLISRRWDVGLAEGAFGHLGKTHETGSVTLKTTNLALRYHF
jgi:OmpA-like transmembrane domain